MFKIKAVAFLFCLTSTIANAQTFQVTRTMQCSKASEVLKIIPNYGESIVWQGKDSKNLLSVLTLNTTTQTWTLILTDGEFACVMDEGTGFVVSPAQKPENKKEPEKNSNL